MSDPLVSPLAVQDLAGILEYIARDKPLAAFRPCLRTETQIRLLWLGLLPNLSRKLFMSTDEITVHVRSDVARAYKAASEPDRRKMDLLVSLQLTEFVQSPQSLDDAMSAMSREARRNGLTPEVLDSILHD